MARPDAPRRRADAPVIAARPGGRGDPRRAVLIALMITLSLAALDSTVVTTAVPSIVRDLGGFELFPWVFSIYLLTQAVTVPIYGKMADLFGRKPVLFVGIGIFLAGSVLCGLAWSMVALIVFRGLQGLGAGAILPMVQTVIGDNYSVAERARVTAYTSGVWAAASVLGPLMGGAFSQFVSWRWIFYVNVPIALIAVVMLQRHLRESVARARHEIDYLGAAVLSLGLVGLVLALLEGGSAWPWTSPVELTTLVGALIVLAVFALWERRAAEPMVPTWIMRRRPLVSCNLVSLAIGACLLGFSTFFPTWAQGVRHVDPLVSGLTVASITLGWPVASSNAGRLYLRIGYRNTAFIGVAFALVGVALCCSLGPSTPIAVAAVYGAITGVGLGFLSTPILIGSQSLVGWERRGVVTASNLFARTIGSALGIAVFGAVANSVLAADLASAPRRVAARLGDSVDAASKVLGGGKVELPAAAAAYVREGLSRATHDVFVAVFVAVLVGLVGVVCIPRRLEPLDFGEDDATRALGDEAGVSAGVESLG